MRHSGRSLLAVIAAAAFGACSEMPADIEFGLVVHGGAGTLGREDITPEKERALRAALTSALDVGHAILANGGSSTDAVVAAIVLLEDSPLFNAGVGAVYNSAGEHELDASIMDGATLNAGAVAGVRTVKNPITLARAVMDHSPHVMLVADGAEEFGRTVGTEFVSPDYFDTDFRREQWERRREQAPDDALLADPLAEALKFGTVGAVALDSHGNLAAATSTGGMTFKRYGRVGDSPVIGAGTYADNESCAVSATGHGEYFIRFVVAHDICARVRYRGVSLERAADEVVMKKLVEAGGSGGVIAIDRRGNIAMPFNTPGMYRGYRLAGEPAVTHIFAP
jgi:beta-aspartyl-peptidase (threonine type)